ncbi:MAG: hypothetical protein ACK5JF_10005 [Oscillospiraceae bacterium]
MQKKQAARKKNIVFVLISIFVLLVAMLGQLPQMLNSQDAVFYDSTSDNLMKSDLHYMQQYGVDGPFARSIKVQTELSGHSAFPNAAELAAFLESGQPLPQSDYNWYISNLCVQRYFYHTISVFSPFSPSVNYDLLKGVNVILFALVLTGVLLWIKRYAGFITAYILVFVLALLSPIFTGFSSNLYWMPYIWFVPMLGSAFVVWIKKKFANIKKWYLLAFVVSFVTCLFYQLHYFEYMSSAMIAMVLPYIASAIEDGNKKIVGIVKAVILPSIGACLSFVVAMGGKVALMMMTSYPDKINGVSPLQSILYTIGARTGNDAFANDMLAPGAETSLLSILKEMFKAQPINVSNLLSVSFLMVVLVL